MIGTTHVFTYGSLMFDRIWSDVVRGRYRPLPGTLFGYRRKCIHGEHYPALIPGSISDAVEGVLYLDVDGPDLHRLDTFEGSYYFRQTLTIHTENNLFQAEVYMLSPSYRHIVTDQDWDPQRFGDNGIDTFISTYFGFDP